VKLGPPLASFEGLAMVVVPYFRVTAVSSQFWFVNEPVFPWLLWIEMAVEVTLP
jgi:hypothetical protein